jgi:hypothetical protein
MERAKFGAGQDAGRSEPVGTDQWERDRDENASHGVAAGVRAARMVMVQSEGETGDDVTDQNTE